MKKIDKIIGQIQETLSDAGVDYCAHIRDFRQLCHMKKRKRAEKFDMRAHVKGLLYSQLSNQRPWGHIEENLAKIDKIFMNYDPAKLKKADREKLVQNITDIRCGNRKIRAQMQHLTCNIRTLETVDRREPGGLDAFVVSKNSGEIARELSAGKYKLREIGFALATEYLRNVGIDTVKPDTHICRIIASDRLNFVDSLNPKPEEAHDRLTELAKKSKHSATYIDAVFWMFAADGYGEICTAEPKCEKCRVSLCQRHPSQNARKRT